MLLRIRPKDVRCVMQRIICFHMQNRKRWKRQDILSVTGHNDFSTLESESNECFISSYKPLLTIAAQCLYLKFRYESQNCFPWCWFSLFVVSVVPVLIEYYSIWMRFTSPYSWNRFMIINVIHSYIWNHSIINHNILQSYLLCIHIFTETKPKYWSAVDKNPWSNQIKHRDSCQGNKALFEL